MNTSKLKPDWAGDNLLSRFVNLLIQTKPIYNILKRQARQVVIKNAEKKGIPWRKNYQELVNSGVEKFQKENPNIVYPDYYCVPFHAYDEGNLCWQAALEAESATYAVALRIWKNESLTWQEAQARLRQNFLDLLASYSPQTVTDILDIGCSVGISTQYLHQYYSQKQNTPIHTVGLDLSPYMLAVAKKRDLEQNITWVHGKAEATEFPDNSFDIVTLQFVLHELPRYATLEIFQEVLRILRPGGVMAIIDIDPASAAVQNMSSVKFTLMKSTEPWIDDYFTFDVEAAIQEVGLDYQTTVSSNPRHRAIIATKP